MILKETLFASCMQNFTCAIKKYKRMMSKQKLKNGSTTNEVFKDVSKLFQYKKCNFLILTLSHFNQ
jgi:hypothetical protein